MRRLALSLLAVVLVACIATVMWPRVRPAHAYATYSVAGLLAALPAHEGRLRAHIIAVHGYYHHGCPSCSWDAPPSLTTSPSWGGPSIIVALPDTAASAGEPAWLSAWRALPLLGRLAPADPSGPLEGFTTFVGSIGPLCAQATICDTPPFVLHVRQQAAGSRQKRSLTAGCLLSAALFRPRCGRVRHSRRPARWRWRRAGASPSRR